MTETPEVPPMSGDNLPLKELEPEKMLVPEKPKKGLSQLLIIIVPVIVLSIIIGLVIGLIIKKEYQSLASPPPIAQRPSPPSPVVSSSPDSKDLKTKINDLKTSLDELEFVDVPLKPPVLNFDIRF